MLSPTQGRLLTLYSGDARLFLESLEYVQRTASRILAAIVPLNSATDEPKKGHPPSSPQCQWSLSKDEASDVEQVSGESATSDRGKIRTTGRKAASSLAVHEYLQAHPLTKIGPAAKDLKLSIPTVTSALEWLTKLKIVKESTGKGRDRLFAYPRYLHILSEGTEPWTK